MKIILAGGTGFVGRAIGENLLSSGHEVFVLTRKVSTASIKKIKSVAWDAKTQGNWAACFDGADAVVNLTGENIAGARWSEDRKKRLLSSRVDATRAVVNAMQNARNRPPVLINASAVGFYGDVPDAVLTETSARGDGFLAETCEEWEAEAHKAELFGTRVVLARLGPVLGEKGGPSGKQDKACPSSPGGMLSRMIFPFRFFIGAPLGTGRQWIPWIHLEDVAGIFLFMIERGDLEGAVNITSPEPVTMKTFCGALAKILRRPCGVPIPGFLLKMMLGEMSAVVLSSQKVLPEKLISAGYRFRYRDISEALGSILKKSA